MRFVPTEINNSNDLTKARDNHVLFIKDDTWDYRSENTKSLTHGFHSYPAMMIPQVAGRLIDEFGRKDATILDPFCGSGTVLVEAMRRGNRSIGIDINPLALLMARAKTTPLDIADIQNVKHRIVDKFRVLDSVKPPEFNNINFWFKSDIISDLSKLKNAIDKSIRRKAVREFFYVAFSETVRDVSNTRNSEFKLFRIPEEKLRNHRPEVLKVFKEKVNKNISGLRSLRSEMLEIEYKQPVVLREDARIKTSLDSNSIDLIVTSPPYGDSRTTVAYGQFSRLSMQWLEMYDTNVDIESLGGRVPKDCSSSVIESQSFEGIYKGIYKNDLKRAKEVFAFFSDLKKCFKEFDRVLKTDAISCFVVGNRTVKGINIPTSSIIAEFGVALGWKHLCTITRNIPNKRMPSKNSPTNIVGKTGSTMTSEYIVVLKK